MTDKKKILAKLFFSTLYLSAFTFGGGYVIVTLMKQKFVDELHWIQEDEMLDLIAIAQSAPGAIAVNGAIVVGFKLAGVLGAVTAIVATIIPPFLIITVISYFYELFRDNYIVSSVLSGMQGRCGRGHRFRGAGHGRRRPETEIRPLYSRYVNRIHSDLRLQGQRGVYHSGLYRHRHRPNGRPAKEERPMIYLQLFLSFLQIGALSFGGGYAAMPLIQAQIVTEHQWLSMSEFTDLVTIAEMTPGPIAVNSATFVGTKIAGVPGALVATAGCILPACILVTLIAKLYLKYRNIAVLQSVLGSLRPAVVAMIASAGVLILRNAFWSGAIRLSGTNWNMVALFAAAFLLLRRTKLSPILVMLLAGAANLIISLITP